MLKKIALAVLAFIVLGAVLFWFTVGQSFYQAGQLTKPEAIAKDLALQDNSRIDIPAFVPGTPLPRSETGNLYWGELHLHTAESFDARLFGTTLGVEDAYKFARGARLQNPGMEPIQLWRPLDFVAITDHAEGFGTVTACADAAAAETRPLMARFNCALLADPNPAVFMLITGLARGKVEGNDPSLPAGGYQAKVRTAPKVLSIGDCPLSDLKTGECAKYARADWQRFQKLADAYYEPGVFTTFAAYEYSPPLPDAGKHHRNIIFKGTEGLPPYAYSALDVTSAPQLWRLLEEDCVAPCDFFTIPHSMNKGWGLFYSQNTWEGGTYTEADWRLRERREPLAEIFQVKGASECALGVGAADEECGFAQVLEPCQPGQETGCAFETAFARQGLKTGLKMKQEMGFNPLAFGHIAATDSHNANPGDVEEADFMGKAGLVTAPAIRRWRDQRGQGKPAFHSVYKFHESGGLAGVWAPENTREELFDAMQRKETYATSGPRIALRFFAGWGFDENIGAEGDPVAAAYEGGVPMGGDLVADAQTGSPAFFVWAAADVMDAPLQRMQMVKGWIDEDGQTHEAVVDIACADGLQVNPQTGRCPDNGAQVDIKTCQISDDRGAAELKTVWRDPAFDPQEDAFYYVRVLQNPTCRWSTYDAIRLGVELDGRVPATIRERAWSSPIWVTAN